MNTSAYLILPGFTVYRNGIYTQRNIHKVQSYLLLSTVWLEIWTKYTITVMFMTIVRDHTVQLNQRPGISAIGTDDLN